MQSHKSFSNFAKARKRIVSLRDRKRIELAERRSASFLREKPEWVKQVDTCLHDANRNMMHVNGVLEYLFEEIEARHSKNPVFSFPLSTIKNPKLRRMISLARELNAIENEIWHISKRSKISQAGMDAISEKAKRLLDIGNEQRSSLKFFSKEIERTNAKFYAADFLRNSKIVEASLAPLINQSPKRYDVRVGIDMKSFFSNHSKKRFIDREGKIVNARFRVIGEPFIKANREGLEAQLNNLVQDAINHNPQKPVFVDVALRNGFVSLQVYNEGTAIPPERLKLIGHDAYWSRGKGRLRGRGKMSVRQFCEDHGGELRVYNIQRREKHFGPCLEMLLPAA